MDARDIRRRYNRDFGQARGGARQENRRLRIRHCVGAGWRNQAFDVYQDGGALVYVKAPCAADDARGRFWLSIFPADEADLSQSARDDGRSHNSLNFDFHSYGAIFDGKCVIPRPLPDYLIAAIETGQWVPGGARLWTANFEMDGASDGE